MQWAWIIPELPPLHPQSAEKLSSPKLVPGAKKGTAVSDKENVGGGQNSK